MRYNIFLILLVTLYGCANVPGVKNEALSTVEQPKCTSAVEAYLHSDTVYYPKPPFILFKKTLDFSGTRYFPGSIVELNDTGVVFTRRSDGLYRADSKFYPVQDIACLVDSNNQIILGQWKKDVTFWNIELVCQKLDDSKAPLFTLILQPNQKVSYCVAPGEYKVLYMGFRNTDDYLDRSDSLCCGRFTVKNNEVTYIGNFTLEYRWTPKDEMTFIPITVLHRPGMNSTQPLFIGGSPITAALGGAVMGGLQYLVDQEKAEKEKRESPFHALKVSADSNYVPLFKKYFSINYSPILIKY